MLESKHIRQYIINNGVNNSKLVGVEEAVSIEIASMAFELLPRNHKDSLGLHRAIRYELQQFLGKKPKSKYDYPSDIGQYFVQENSKEPELFEKYSRMFKEELFKVTGEAKGSG